MKGTTDLVPQLRDDDAPTRAMTAHARREGPDGRNSGGFRQTGWAVALATPRPQFITGAGSCLDHVKLPLAGNGERERSRIGSRVDGWSPGLATNARSEEEAVFPSQFEYHRPSTVADAVKMLSQNPDAKVLAGGHSLLPAMKLRLAAPAALVDLGSVEGLSGITVNGNVVIGAMTTYAELRDSAELKQALPMVPETAYNVGDPQVQALGTLGGSLAHADPASDFTAVALALDASVKAVGAKGERVIPAEDLFVDLLTTSLAPDEVLTEVHIPTVAARSAMAYEKFRHPASGYAVVGVAAVVSVGDDGNVAKARIAVTGATSKATRATAAENALVGTPLNADSIAAAAAAANEGLDLNGDHFASAEYRAHLLEVYTRRALERIATDLG